MYDGSNGGMNPNPNPGSNGGMLPPVMNPTPPSSGPGGPVNALTINYWLKTHWKLLLVIFIAILVVGQVIFQIVYPSSRLIPGATLDGEDIGGMKYDEAAKKMDQLYGTLKLDIFFGNNDAAFQSPKMSEVGIGVDNSARVQAITYPFYLRFVPTSIWWAAGLSQPGEIAYKYDRSKIISYTLAKVGEDCSIPPQNATLKLVESQLQLVPAVTGGTCDINDFQQKLSQVEPDAYKQNKVQVAIDETPAPVTDDMARDLAAKLNGRLAAPMPITVDSSTDTIPGRIVLSWLDFKANVPEASIDNSANQQASLQFSVNAKRAEDYLNQGIAAKLVKKPGVSRVSTLDFKETSRVNGANGRGVDMPRIVQSVEDYINNRIQKAVGATRVVGPTTVYTRSYTPTSVGFAALLAQYDEDNPGSYTAAFQELSGVEYPRKAEYRGNERVAGGGIHSLYLAYTQIMQERAGVVRPVDIISGDMNAVDCFRYMLQRFDEGCRVGFYNLHGYAQLTSRASQLGLTNTVFAGEQTVTSANDLQKVLVGLYKNQIARVEGGQRILSEARSNRHKEGIPTGSGSTQVTHVIGEADGVYNDTSIVYNTNYGAYALTIMASGEGASWEKVAGLAKKVIGLKSVKIPKGAR